MYVCTYLIDHSPLGLLVSTWYGLNYCCFCILTFFSGIGDLEFSASAYSFALLSVVCQSFYLTYIQKTGVEKGLSTLTVLHTNCINCIPLLLIYTVCSKELLSALRFGRYIDPSFQVCWKCCHFKFYFICMAL